MSQISNWYIFFSKKILYRYFNKWLILCKNTYIIKNIIRNISINILSHKKKKKSLWDNDKHATLYQVNRNVIKKIEKHWIKEGLVYQDVNIESNIFNHMIELFSLIHDYKQNWEPL